MNADAAEILQALEGTTDVCTALDREYNRRSRWHNGFIVLVWVVAFFTAALIASTIGLLIWLVLTLSTASAVEHGVKIGGAAVTGVGGFVTGKAMGVLTKLRDDAEGDVNDILDRMRDAQCSTVPTPAPPKLM